MKKQKSLHILLFAILIAFTVLPPVRTSAATTDVTGGTNGPLCNSGGYFTPSSVTVTSGDTLTISVPSNDPYAGGVQVNGFPQGSFVVPRGGSVTTQALTADVSYRGTWPNSPSCIKGSGTVTVQAASSPVTPPSTPVPTTPNPTPASNTKTTTTSTGSNSKSTVATSTPATTTSTTAASNATVATPATVVADTITVAGQKITSIGNLSINQSQPLVLSGQTVPNGTITLTIHSNPITATVQANPSGAWTYTVTDLPAGNHTIFAAVTDPTTHQTSATSKLLAFTVKATSAATVTTATSTSKKSMSPVLVATACALVLIIIVIIVLVLKRKKQVTTAISPNSPAAVMPDTGPAAQAGTGVVPTTPVADDHNEKKDLPN